MEDISVFTDKNAEPAESDLSKTELKSAKVYAEGRGSEINRLLEICMSYNFDNVPINFSPYPTLEDPSTLQDADY